MKIEELYKNRSYSGCIKAGYKAITDNAKEILRRTWIVALITALTGGALLMTSLCYGQKPVIWMSVLPFFLLAWLVWLGKTYSLLGGGNLTWNSIRAIKPRLLSAVFNLAIALLLLVLYNLSIYIIGPDKLISRDTAILYVLGSAIIFTVVVALLNLPFYYCYMRYQFNREATLWKTMTKGYARGIRHFGLLFIIAFIVYIVASLVQIIVFSPCNIIIAANTISNSGVAMGDPSGLPEYFPVLVFIAGVITMYCMAYVMMWIEFTFYFTYGTIETRENERTKAKNLIYRP